MKAVPTNRYFLFLALAVGGCAIDLASKAWVFDWLGLPGPAACHWVWDGQFALQTSLNEGALFGFGQGKVAWFAVLSIAAAVAILYWLFIVGAAVDLWLTVALGCITGGIFGNLYDRLGWHELVWPVGFPKAGQSVYAVRDWILWQVNDGLRWPNFNIADSLLVCGAGMLLWHSFRQSPAADDGAQEKAKLDSSDRA